MTPTHPLYNHQVRPIPPKSIVLHQDGCEDEDPFEVDRHEIIAEWSVHKVVQTISYTPGQYADPATSDDLLISVWQGHIKAMLIEAFGKSSEPNCIVQHQPALKVFAIKSSKQGGLTLVCLTNSIIISNKKAGDLMLGECFAPRSNGQMRLLPEVS